MSYKIFVVEDDPWYNKLIVHHLKMNPNYELISCTDGASVLNKLTEKPDLICMDFGLPDMDGSRLLKEIKKRNPDVPVIVISGQEEIEVAVKLLKSGATDYLIKGDHTPEVLWKSIIQIRENQTLRKENSELKQQLEEKFTFEKSIIGESKAIKKTFLLLNKAVQSNINVSLSGETGTGKEVYAKAIHYNSSRKKGPFVAVNMASIPKDLAESELFGFEKGAFTGAINARKGKFEEATGGTLFLDEIGEMEPNLQGKLLRVLQERVVTRIGSNKPLQGRF